MSLPITPGSPGRLGATVGDGATSFALHAPEATAVELCLFDPSGAETRLPLPGFDGGVWHGRVSGIGPGQLYGYRVHGPYEPAAGRRFNPHKLLIDPYARGLSGRIRWDDATFGYDPASPDGDLSFDTRDSAPFMPRCVVEATVPPVDAESRPRRPWAETVIYEAHVKGLTALHPAIPDAERGTFDALGHPALIAHLLDLGITAVELLPVQAFADDHFLQRRGLVNYWGYSTLAFLAPEPRYLGPGGADGFRRAVAALHRAGIEVILDIVFNHTAELEETGPTLSWRGIDPAAYRLLPGDRRRTVNWTGCGNTLDFGQAAIRRLAVDSMAHWVRSYGIDGFRFDLAPVVGRDGEAFTADAAFFHDVAAEPALRDVKLIAEPWDLGPDGYRLGAFPRPWAEWNDRTRDDLRAFWRGDATGITGVARALAGSREIFGPAGRTPVASVNYVTSHDGFTLADLVSYEHRHNGANGEDNRDGHGHNLSCNHGVEGPSDDPAIRTARARHRRALLACALLARGVPMLLGGDELGRTQGGNNNAYAQDNPTTWLDWSGERDMADAVARLTRIRREHSVLRADAFYEPGDVAWLRPDGAPLDPGGWDDPDKRAFAVRIADGPLLLLLNAGPDPVPFDRPGGPWTALYDADAIGGEPRESAVRAGTILLPPRSVVLLRSNHQDPS